MKPVRTERSNMVYKGPTPDIGDLHCERVQPGHIQSTWWLSPFEREQIAAGGNIALGIFGEPIPPVSLNITFDQGIGEDAPEVLERLQRYAAEAEA